MSDGEVVLEANGISQQFGGLAALEDVTIRILAGTVRGIIGPNGAGKTTFLNVISGLQKPTRGRVLISGINVTGWPPDRLVREAGVARTFQTAKLFPRMSVWENVLVAAGTRTVKKSAAAKTAEALIQRFNLKEYGTAFAKELPYGVQRRVELARALATRPALFLLDEPAAGLNAGERAELGEILLEFAADGLAVVLVEHQLDLVRATCATLTALDFGKVIAEGTVGEVMTHPAVVEAYVGVSRQTEKGIEHDDRSGERRSG